MTEKLKQLGLDEETAKRAAAFFGDELDKRCAELKERSRAELDKARLDAALEIGLLKSGCGKLRVLRALINKDSLSLNSEGVICGLDEQIAALKADSETGFLFEKGTPQLVGMSIAEEGSDFDEPLTYEELCKMQ